MCLAAERSSVKLLSISSHFTTSKSSKDKLLIFTWPSDSSALEAPRHWALHRGKASLHPEHPWLSQRSYRIADNRSWNSWTRRIYYKQIHETYLKYARSFSKTHVNALWDTSSQKIASWGGRGSGESVKWTFLTNRWLQVTLDVINL